MPSTSSVCVCFLKSPLRLVSIVLFTNFFHIWNRPQVYPPHTPLPLHPHDFIVSVKKLFSKVIKSTQTASSERKEKEKTLPFKFYCNFPRKFHRCSTDKGYLVFLLLRHPYWSQSAASEMDGVETYTGSEVSLYTGLEDKDTGWIKTVQIGLIKL